MNIRDLTARLAFPVTAILTLAAANTMLAAGWAPPTVVGVCVPVAYAGIALLERLVPYRESWLHSKGDLKTDIAWLFTNSALNRIVEPLFLAVGVAVAAWISANWGWQIWPRDLPLLVQLVPALIFVEFFEYSFHRLMHENATMWRFHATHHSAPRLYWLNAVRFHPVDYTLVGIGKLVPLAMVGASAELFAMVNVFSAVHGAFQHANVPAKMGPLNYVFSMAELHRWHHSPLIAEANHNYGGNLILWDLVFGTRYLPEDREPPEEIGLEDPPEFPDDFVGQVLSPIRWPGH
jgi:sterol desaturase/sphingolipid hydroxylase (fatty acid hydroxylase superfamily)